MTHEQREALWYLASMVIAWAVQIVYDSTMERQARLQPQVFYVSVALIWPLVVCWVLCLVTIGWLRTHRAAILKAVRSTWHHVQQLRKVP